MWLKSLTEWKKKGIPCAIATIVKTEGSTPRQAGSTMVVNLDGDIAGSVGGGSVEYECMEIARKVIAENRTVLETFSLREDAASADEISSKGICGGEVTVFIEPVRVQKTIMIFGAGHIAEKLGRLCSVLEIPYSVFDDRKEFLSEERFPGAEALYHGDFTKIKETVLPGAENYCVIMTYGHKFDENCLEQLVQMPEIPYIGMIGSPKKVAIIVEHLRNRNVMLDDRVYSPVGLRIGRNLPQEVALSILSEVVLLMEGGSQEHFRIKWN